MITGIAYVWLFALVAQFFAAFRVQFATAAVFLAAVSAAVAYGFSDRFIAEDIVYRYITYPYSQVNSIPERGTIAVPGGPFFMGCNEKVDKECGDDEKPLRMVSVKAFFIDRTEVTVSAYAECVKAGECSKPNTGTWCNWGERGREKHPINCVDWNQASKFCAWKGKRLPTEAEWEKAARGTDGRKYPWGNQRVICNYAVVADCGGGTQLVGSKLAGASPYGALDMVGNVWEWTDSWGDESEREHRVVRGGSWHNQSAVARVSYRNWYTPDTPDSRSYDVGFRCVRAAD